MFPENIVITVAPYTPVSNELGSPRDAWGPPVPRRVIGVAPPSPDAPIRETSTGLKIVRDVLASSWEFPPKSKVTVGTQTFLQDGHPEDYNMGPFGFRPGVRVNLTGIEG